MWAAGEQRSAQNRRRPATKLRRVGKDRLVERSVDVSATRLDFSNAEQFDAIDDAVALLYYTESVDEVLFDADNDRALVGMHVAPFAFKNDESLSTYEALISRAHYYCKPHPNQALAREQAAVELSTPADDLLVMVYKRDAASASGVRLRNKTPFRNPINGISVQRNGESTQLSLFKDLSFDPYADVVLVWQREPRINATVGLIGLRVDKIYS